MRKLSVLLTVLITLLQLQEAQAQCTIARPAIKLNSTSTNPLNGKCLINLDLYFDMDANAGVNMYLSIFGPLDPPPP